MNPIKLRDDLTIFILSDSLGTTAEAVIDAIVSQFETSELNFKITKFNNTQTESDLNQIINQAKDIENLLIIYTIVLPKLKRQLEEATAKYDLNAIDILGPAIDKITALTGHPPKLTPGLNHKIDKNYFRRIECIEFAVNCDDGQNLHKLSEADIVIIGISRTSKTPLSIYLAHNGYKVANVPLIPGVDPPPEIYNLKSYKTVGLIINPTTLKKIRQKRLEELKFNQPADYTDLDEIFTELEHAEKIMRKIGCMKLDVTNKSIEETAHRILSNRDDLKSLFKA